MISDFLKDIHPIPVVFRLFHEMTGWWYWWGTHSCETQDFIDAWQYTVDYIIDFKAPHTSHMALQHIHTTHAP